MYKLTKVKKLLSNWNGDGKWTCGVNTSSKLVIFTFLWCNAILVNSAYASELTVRIEGKDTYQLVTQSARVYVTLAGEIDNDAPARVEAALKKVEASGGVADVYLTSPGGSLFAGMAIGRLLRKYGAFTHVGSVSLAPDNKYPKFVNATFTDGVCFSSCTLAFLGGTYRFASVGSEFGVHRFYSNSTPTSIDTDTAQIVSAAVSSFIREMNVSPDMFDLMVQKGRDSIKILSPDEQRRLNIINDGQKQSQWSIEALKGGQYLKGVQDSMYGEGKAVFSCMNRRLILQSFYESGNERALAIVNGKWFHSLLLDDTTVALPAPIKTSASGSEIYSLFELTKAQSLRIAKSKSFGHAMQVSRDAPSFVGYRIEIKPADVTKVEAFISNCYL